MQSIIAWKDIRIAVCFVVAIAACGYEPPDTDGSTSGAGGFGGDQGNASSSSSGKGGATSNASSSSGKGGDAVSSSSGNVSSSSSSGDANSSSSSGNVSSSSSTSSSSSSSSGSGGVGTVACGGGTECTPIIDTYGCCVFASSTPYCRNPAQCMMSPTFYCDGREDCGGAWCCLEGNTKSTCSAACNTAYVCMFDEDCPATAPTCKPNVFGPIGKCVFQP